MIKQQIETDLKTAMIAKDQVKTDALRMLKSRIKNEEIAKQKDFSEEELQSIIASEIKRRKDSVQAYITGNRPELAEKEQQEIDALAKYLPEQLSEEQVRAIIEEKLSGQDLSAKDFGKAMGLVMPSLKGRAEGDLVSKLLKEKLK